MRRFGVPWAVAAAGVIVTIVACGGGGDDGPGTGPRTCTSVSGNVIAMPGFVFTPFCVSIARGDSVAFDFPTEPHNVIFNKLTGVPGDIPITNNRTVYRRFNTTGKFPYDCTLHPGMSGEVEVK
jgi:plastocyanin